MGCKLADYFNSEVYEWPYLSSIYTFEFSMVQPDDRPVSCTSHVDYLFDHHFTTNDQSAYRSGHSTETALHRVIIDLVNGANEVLVSGVCFLT